MHADCEHNAVRWCRCTWDYLRAVWRGEISPCLSEVVRAGPAGVTLRYQPQEGSRGGTEEDLSVDTLVFATGFEDGPTFLDDGMLCALCRQPDGLPLYRHIAPPRLPGVFFVGHVATFALGLTVSMQAAWVAEVVQGRLALPGQPDMQRDILRWEEATAGGRLSPMRRHAILSQCYQYVDQLARDIGLESGGRRGGPLRAVAAAVIPQHPAQYKAVLTPPGLACMPVTGAAMQTATRMRAGSHS